MSKQIFNPKTMEAFSKELAIQCAELMKRDEYRNMFCVDTSALYAAAFFSNWILDLTYQSYTGEDKRSKEELKKMLLEIIAAITVK